MRWTLLIVYLLLGQSTAILLYAEITPVSIYASSALFGLSFYAIFGLVPAYISHVYKNNTAAIVFAFGGNVLFAASFFVVQRTSQAKLWGSDKLLKFIFFGYQTRIL